MLAAILLRPNMQRLDPEPRGERWAVVGVVNPTDEVLTQKLVDTTTAGATQRSYEGVNAGGFGTGASVIRLATIGSPNSPSVQSPTWSTLLKRKNRDGGATYYVAGHLVNGTFGGPGGDWRNLTPLTQRANNSSVQSMLHTFENPVRDAVRLGGICDLTVRIIYGQPSRAADAQRARAIMPPAKGMRIAELIEAEQSVPSEMRASATIVSSSGQARPPLSSTTLNVVDTNLANYFHADFGASASTPSRLVNLNSASATDLSTLVGVDSALAQRIEQSRPYDDARDFIAKLGVDGGPIFQHMVSTAGVSLRY